MFPSNLPPGVSPFDEHINPGEESDDPRTRTLEQCMEALMLLEAPCSASGWRDDEGRHSREGGRCTTCGGTGKVYPLRKPCPCDIGFSAADDYACARCHGTGYLPVEPHLETYRAAALQAGYDHDSAAIRCLDGNYSFVHEFRYSGSHWGTRALSGVNDLLTCARALVLAKQAREAA